MWNKALNIAPKIARCTLLGGAVAALTACGAKFDTLAPLVAQPKTPAARNITSFTPALHCMDSLLELGNKPSLRITSTQIPDRTKSISVGAEDMLINALNQMNRRSQAYIYIDQGIAKSSSGAFFNIEFDDPKAKVKPTRPQYYISGSISQLDDSVRRSGIGSDITPVDSNARGLGSVERSNDRSNSVVTVDLHLVTFPSRQIIPGGSVSNSMVVTRKGFGSNLTGRITQSTMGFALQVQRLESNGQAVRNLIELGLIELLGQHARVPFWDCLSLETTNARKNAKQERQYIGNTEGTRIREAQAILISLGRLGGTENGELDRDTRIALAKFQAEHRLISSGEPDFDTLNALRQAVAKPAPTVRQNPTRKKATRPATTASVAPPPRQSKRDGYQSISDFLQP